MNLIRNFNTPAAFGLGVAAAMLAAVVLGHFVNHAVYWSIGLSLLAVEGALISEAALDGLAGLACFYLACGATAACRRRKASSSSDSPNPCE